MTKVLDLVCFGYLSAAQILTVDKYPDANSVAKVTRITKTLAADAPIVALLSAHLGLKSMLLSNDVGFDEDGKYLISTLRHQNFQTTIKSGDDLVTPQMFITDDSQKNKTIFTFMPGIIDQLMIVDSKVLDWARFVYVDLYSEIIEPSIRVILYAVQKGIPVFLNLSSHDLDHKLAVIKNLEGITIVQVSNIAQEEPKMLADAILGDTKAKIALVTLGQRGVLGANRATNVHVPALNIRKIETHHGAGAAFSAGFAFAYLKNFGFRDSLVFACALAGFTRQVPNGLGNYSAAEVLNLMRQHPIQPSTSQP